MSNLKQGIFSVCCIAIAVTGLSVLGIGAADAQAPAGGSVANVCFPRTADMGSPMLCVPMSVLQATFTDYQPGQPAPTLAIRQALINVQVELAETLRLERQCEGQLGPLAAQAHTEALKQQQAALDKALTTSAPPDTAWDAEAQRYVPKPAKGANPGRGGGR